jgi:hypothetical protein
VRCRGEPHDGGHDLRGRAQRTDALDLLDAVLQGTHHRAVVAQPGQPPRCALILGVLHSEKDHVDRAVDIGRVGQYRARHDDRILAVGSDLDLVTRSVPAQHDVVARGMQQRGHRRADGTWTDDRDAGTHKATLPADSAPLDCGSPLVRPFPGSY